MPIYEYRCAACSKPFDHLLRSSSERVLCPDCGAPEPTRLLSVFGFHVSGGTASAKPSSGGGCARCSGGSCSCCAHRN